MRMGLTCFGDCPTISDSVKHSDNVALGNLINRFAAPRRKQVARDNASDLILRAWLVSTLIAPLPLINCHLEQWGTGLLRLWGLAFSNDAPRIASLREAMAGPASEGGSLQLAVDAMEKNEAL